MIPHVKIPTSVPRAHLRFSQARAVGPVSCRQGFIVSFFVVDFVLCADHFHFFLDSVLTQ
jgi:hypothetical protein